ncbi:hypothetical protein TSUD_121460 [Trifolium subterraneum]|nr:hypothetical protein TSUD_121460 [Trifolium subterraneum]
MAFLFISNLHHILPFKFPVPKSPFNSDTSSFCYFSKQTIFLIKPPPQQQQQQQTLVRCPWLIKVTQNPNGKPQLSNPFHLDTYPHNPFHHRHVLDFNKFSVLQLRTIFIFDYHFTQAYQSYDGGYMFPGYLVAVTSREHQKPLVIGAFSGAESVMFKCGDENWKVIPDMSSYLGDICLFKGQPYVVDKIGRTVMVGWDSSVQLVAEPLVGGGGYNKFLVESEGDLLLADVYDCSYTEFPNYDPVRIDLFKLDEKEKKWVQLTSLGDRVLLLEESCSFSVSASDLHIAHGNCVIFEDNIFKPYTYKLPQTCILHLDDGRISLLDDCHEYDNLFWPPPEWIIPTSPEWIILTTSRVDHPEYVTEYVLLHPRISNVI